MSIPTSNPQTFGWIKPALNQSMLQAMESLSSTENGADSKGLDVVSQNLHQIRGSLQMVELDAAGVLAEDLEVLTGRTRESNLQENLPDRIELIKQGLRSLENYLYAIDKQEPVSPLVLVEDINAVRAELGRTPITPYELFDPPLEMDLPELSGRTLDVPRDKTKKLLFDLRKRFRKSLLNWLNGQEQDQALSAMIETMAQVQKVSGLDISRQLWWVATGFVESIQSGEIEAHPGVKAQFAQLDREMSRAGEGNLAQIASAPPNELLRQMLYYIGNIRTNGADPDMTSRTNQIKDRLGLEQWFSPLYSPRDLLEEDDQELGLEKFAGVIDEKYFSELENNIDLYFAGDMENDQVQRLFGQIDQLQQVAADHDLGILYGLVEAFCDSLRKVDTDVASLARTAADIKIASALLFLKDCTIANLKRDDKWEQSVIQKTEELSGLSKTDDIHTGTISQGGQQALVEFEGAKSAVIAEINSSLDHIEEILSRKNRAEVENLDIATVADYLKEISNWLLILEAEELASLCRDSADKASWIGDELNRDNSERFAFIIVSISACCEQIEMLDHEDSSIIERARRMLDSITRPDNVDTGLEINLVEGEDGRGEEEKKVVNDGEADLRELDLPEEAPILTDAVDSGSVGFAGTVTEQIEQLDHIRKSLRASSNPENEFIRLSLVFGVIEDHADSTDQEDLANLAEIGSHLAKSLVEGVADYDEEVDEFLGLLAKQIKQLDNGSVSGVLDLPEWHRRFDALLGEVSTKHAESEIGLEIAPGLANDNELRRIFVDELLHNAKILKEEADQIEKGLKKDNVDGVIGSHYENINRVFHTLSGNFKNLGLSAIGDRLESMEAFAIPGSEDPEIAEQYCGNVIDLSNVVYETAATIDQQEPLGDELVESYSAVAEQFRLVQQEVAKRAVSLADTLGDELELFDSNAAELDFSINELNEVLEVLEDEEDGEVSGLAGDDSTTGSTVPNRQDLEIQQLFMEESEGILDSINSHLSKWGTDGIDEDVLGGLRREFHTLKGSAAATGFDDVSRLSHAVEGLLEQGTIDTISGDSGTLNLMEEVHDGLAAEIGIIPGSDENHVKALISMVELLVDGSPMPDQEDIVANDPATQATEVNPEAVIPAAELPDSDNDVLPGQTSLMSQMSDFEVIKPQPVTTDRQMELGGDTGTASLRIENRKIADLLNYSGEMGLTRTRIRSALDGTRSELEGLREGMKRIRDGLRDLEFEADAQMRALPESSEFSPGHEEFDPLQLDRYSKLQARAREVNQQLDMLSRIERELTERASELDGALIQQTHLGEQLQDGLMSARMVSINDYLPRLRQLVRETSRRHGKPVEFSVTGGDIEVDRQVMDTMMPPFEHMIRNAIIHGIEDAEMRGSLGKESMGRIIMDIVQQGSELLIEFGDDGGGIDRERIAGISQESGTPVTVDEMTDEFLLQLITQPGYTTSETVSMDSGRGVGMDVVYQAVRTLGGSMALAASDESGVRFQFRLPVTMTISQALMVKVGTYRFAILTRTIDRVMRVSESELMEVDGILHVDTGEHTVPIVNLAEKLGEISLSTQESFRSLVLVRLADRVTAFEVDQFEDTVEVVTKSPGSQLTSIDGITGVTVLADSSIVLILDPGQFIHRPVIHKEKMSVTQESVPSEQRLADANIEELLQTVLIVDDSLVVRKVMQRDIESIGLDVLVAVDGLDALDVIGESKVDLVLLDLEMPRMNGYEMLVQLREDPRYSNLPVIVITSRSGEMHRERAMGLGADGYISKPYDLENLRKLMETVVVNKVTRH